MEEVERKKPGPQAKPKIDVEALLERVSNLEALVLRMAHNNGTAHAIILKSGLQPYTANASDMGKYKKAN